MQATLAILHTHILVVALFLILFISKAVLLFLNKHQTLEKAKRYTRVLDMIFGTLILITGGYLLFQYAGMPAWLLAKLTLVLLAIPLGVAGIRRHNKLLTGLALLGFGYAYGLSETRHLTLNKSRKALLPATILTPQTDAVEAGEDTSLHQDGTVQQIITAIDEAQLANAGAIYRQACAPCHGPDGTRQAGSAAQLASSNLPLQDRIQVIEHGRGLMPAFGGRLTDTEVQALAAYTTTLKQ